MKEVIKTQYVFTVADLRDRLRKFPDYMVITVKHTDGLIKPIILMEEGMSHEKVVVLICDAWNA